jgi:zinc transport system substrate-binding protein
LNYKKKKYIFVLFLLLILSLLGAGVTKLFYRNQNTEKMDEVRIVTSFYPVYIAALNVAGGIEGVRIENLTEPQTGCLHDYQLTAEDVISLNEADIFIMNGGGMESFIEDVVAQYPELYIIDASENISMSEETVKEEVEGHDHGEENAHVWLDTEKYKEQIRNIQNRLSEEDPSHARAYKENADLYIDRIKELTDLIKRDLAELNGKKVIVFHEGFVYFAEEIGMDVGAVIDMDDQTSLSAGEIARIINMIKGENIDILLAEERYGSQIANAVSAETGAMVCIIDPLVTGEMSEDAYLQSMRKNIEVLKEVLHR